jgi:hypothetical protein
MNVANSVLWRMAIILKVNEVNLFVSSVLFVFWYNSPNFLVTPRMFISILLLWRAAPGRPYFPCGRQSNYIYASAVKRYEI